MKIIVHNHIDQYALSRKQIECILETLPKEYFQPIMEFRLLDDSRNTEIFEFSKQNRIAWYSYLAKEKTPEILLKATEELLMGLARIKANSKFYHPLKEQERDEYKPFVDEWLPKCMMAINKKK
jgi:hypothetical protein